MSGVSVHLAGSLESGSGERFAFLSLDKFKHGANFTITLAFLAVWRFVHEALVTGKPLPRRLVFQLDNTAKENKNRWMFAFLAWLKSLGWFRSVDLDFQIKGHTHALQDQAFADIWHAIGRAGACVFHFSVASHLLFGRQNFWFGEPGSGD